MIPGKGPVFKSPLELGKPESVDSLDLVPDVEAKLGHVYDAIHWTYLRLEQQVPVIGFAGAPWSLFGYMVEGCESKTWNKAKRCLYENTESSMNIMNALTNTIIEYLIG